MNKKLVIVMTLVLVFVMSVPVMARDFSDVPAHHWAYDSVRQVSEAGIIRGFGDGTYMGDQPLSRYQMASVTAAILEETAEDNTELSQEMMEVISKLAEEFDAELAVVNEQLAQKDVLTVLGEAGFEYHDWDVTGATAYENPFDFDENEPDVFITEDYFKQYADLGFNIAKDGLEANFELKAVGDYFGNFNDDDEVINHFAIDDISGEIKTEDFTATIANEQSLGWKDFLYSGEYDDENIDGVILDSDNSVLALGKRGETRNIAASYSNFLDLPFTAYLGMEDDEDNSNVVLGMGSELEINGINLTGDFALNDGDNSGQLLKLGAGTKLSIFEVEGNYKYADQFVGIQVDEDFAGDVSGYDLKAGTNVDKLGLAVMYEDYEGDEITLTADVKEDNSYQVLNANLFGNYEYQINSEEQIAYLEANKELGSISLAAFYDMEDSVDEERSDKVLSLAYAPEFEVIGVQLAPQAKLAAIYDIDNEQYFNREAGVKASYDVNEKVSLNSGLNWAEKEARADLAGRLATAEAGIEYKINEDTSANINYARNNFHGEDSANDYNAQGINGGVNIKF